MEVIVPRKAFSTLLEADLTLCLSKNEAETKFAIAGNFNQLIETVTVAVAVPPLLSLMV